MLHDVYVKGSVHVQIVKAKPRLGIYQQYYLCCLHLQCAVYLPYVVGEFKVPLIIPYL